MTNKPKKIIKEISGAGGDGRKIHCVYGCKCADCCKKLLCPCGSEMEEKGNMGYKKAVGRFEGGGGGVEVIEEEVKLYQCPKCKNCLIK